ncbi:MAG: tetrahydromethanopterin S-methyltransferase subunit F [Methanosarcina sp.]|jgi:tetrahydromethanopterin S-methyltransferase subunit F|nr:tetrahydromethanopterin S-methyltransferase subunit F [Methanosarcina sp.]MDD4523558.1 tetrahydromethanopterin S-methyltransferase subunit F [Methanosarcina sp.]HHV25283.1 tetrahydromethanopterin S-methyltransferase subunit F [Methanosarcina sp.]
MKVAQEYDKGVPMVLAPQMGAIDVTVESIRYRAQLIARNQKLDSGVMSTGIVGFAAGFLFSLLMVVVLPVALGL